MSTKTLAAQEIFGDELGGHADAGGLYPLSVVRLRWRLGGGRPGSHSQESARFRRERPYQKFSPGESGPVAHAFNSLFSF